MVKEITKAEANYVWSKIRRNSCERMIASMTEPNVLPGTEEPEDWRQQRMGCLSYHCERLEEWDRRVEYWARELGLPEEKWKREAQ